MGNGQPREPALCQLHRHTFVHQGPQRHCSRLPIASSCHKLLYRHIIILWKFLKCILDVRNTRVCCHFILQLLGLYCYIVLETSCYTIDSQRSHWSCLLRIRLRILTADMFPKYYPPSKSDFPVGDLRPNLVMVLWAFTSPLSKRHLDRFIRFCRAHAPDHQADTHRYV